MNILKTLLMLVIFAGVAGVGLVIAAPKYPQAAVVVDKLHLAALQPVANETLATTAQLQTQLPKLGSVLGVKTEDIKNSPNASLPQKTFEYARYAYCQQVVQDYESRMGITQPATPSARPAATSRPSEMPHPSEAPKTKQDLQLKK
ncbi:hypothetical protein BH10PAT2_BH10PAT2_1760 [soil metagenome]